MNCNHHYPSSPLCNLTTLSLPQVPLNQFVTSSLVLWISLNHDSQIVLPQPGCMSHMISGFCEPGLSTASNFHNPILILVFGASATKHFLNYFLLLLVFYTISTKYNIHQYTSIYIYIKYSRSSPRCRLVSHLTVTSWRAARWLSDLPLLKLFVHVAPCSKPPIMTFSRWKTKHPHHPHKLPGCGSSWFLHDQVWI